MTFYEEDGVNIISSFRLAISKLPLGAGGPFGLFIEISLEIIKLCNWSSIPAIGNSIPSIGNSIPDNGNSIPGIRNSIPGIWNSIPGTRNSIPNIGNNILIQE